jgi:F-type H+-transporting ATPase subunit epsilon
MANDKTLHCSLITPEKSVVECDATAVSLTAHDGEVGFLHNRAPLLTKLGVGVLRITDNDGERLFFIDGGFAQMVNNQLTVLTERAQSADSIVLADVDRELSDAMAMESHDSESRERKDLATARARTKRAVADAARR